MLLIQTITSIAVYTGSVVAPVAAIDYGVSPTWIGGYMSLMYLCAMVSGTLTGDWMRRIGTASVAIAATLSCAIGVAIFGLAHPITGAVAAMLIGFAYGHVNPVSAYTLNLVSPARWRPLIFSIKQTGVVIGGAIAGIAAPALAAAVGWRWASVTIGLVALCSIVALLPLTRRFGKTPNTGTRSVTQAFKHSIALVLEQPRLRAFAIAGIIYSGVQVSIAAFLVVYLNDRLGLSLIEAGGIFAVCQIAGIIGRLVCGAAADNLIGAVYVLVWLAVISLLALVGLAMTDNESSRWTLVLIAGVIGFSSFGWNGVFLSEITGRVETQSVGDTIGGIQFFFFGGVVAMPPLFGIGAQVFGYQSAYLGLAVLALVGGLGVLRASRL